MHDRIFKAIELLEDCVTNGFISEIMYLQLCDNLKEAHEEIANLEIDEQRNQNTLKVISYRFPNYVSTYRQKRARDLRHQYRPLLKFISHVIYFGHKCQKYK